MARRAILIACLVAACAAIPSAHAQMGFDRPGGDYTSLDASSADPAALREWIKNWIEALARLAKPGVSLRTDDLPNQLETFARNQASESKLSLAKAQFVIAPSKGEQTKLFRARLAGFNEKQAQDACSVVKQKGHPCTVISPAASGAALKLTSLKAQ